MKFSIHGRVVLLIGLISLNACADAPAAIADSGDASRPSAPLTQFINKVLNRKVTSPFDSADAAFFQQSMLPTSFVYGGKPSTTLLASWPKTQKQPVKETDRTIYETTWREPNGGLVATWRVEVFRDWPAMEFRWTFTNEGKTPAKALTQVEALDLTAQLGNRGFKVLHSLGGGIPGTNSYDLNDPGLGFALSESDGGVTSLSAQGGVSSNKDLPFFLVHAVQPDEGLFIGIGWSGQWQAKIDGSNMASGVHLTAEMPGMNLALPPGETIISPSILLGTYSGAISTGSNTLRRLLYAKYVPLLDGKKPLPPVSWNSWFILGNGISEDLLEKEADAAARIGVEYLCIDAGWFDGGCPGGIGNWTIDKAKFPHGLRGIGDYVRTKGMKLGLWLEPERIEKNTRVLKEHPNWIRDDVVDLGNRDARDWYFKTFKSLIDEGHVRWIRLDFNRQFPLSTWDANDASDQRGLTQIRHIMGLYALIDRLTKAYPDLFIESCAGGARRSDLEMVKRSHSFWVSDECSIRIARFKDTGANTFFPGVLLNTNMAVDSHVDFASDNILGGPFGLRWDFTKTDSSTLDQLAREITLAKKLRPLLDADYYPLFPQSRDPAAWVGWQFDDPAKGAGYLVVLRPDPSTVASSAIALQGLDAKATYTLTPLNDTPGEVRHLAGAQLAQPWAVELKDVPSGAVYEYSKDK